MKAVDSGRKLERFDNRMDRPMGRHNRTTMNKRQTRNPHTIISRRTGLDRRWIHSADYQPERRRRGDRRAIRRRSVSEPLELGATAENRELFPEINLEESKPERKKPALSFDEKGFPGPPEAISKWEP